ncbi:MAG: cytochrome c oxidase subunit 3 [Rhodospirillaceae bacterium]|jgi:cytochrome c oxidase subunit III|nr:cytochrome c oxidase subunit 3 [Rhodospirillaceae bacterium]MBT5659162.1 cytochrome c oxidase subunit 3 [Rhodospirillaceae bacterium]
MSDHAAKHPYHLVDPSPWPAFGALSAFVAALGFVWFMHDEGSLIFLIGMAMVLFTMFAWWRDVIKEAEVDKAHTPIVQIGLRYGMALFIASEVMFFVAWFWAFFDASIFPGMDSPELIARREVLGGIWPPEGIKTLETWTFPFLNTVILLTSGATLTWAHHALMNGNRKSAVNGLIVTILLAICFTSVQAYEYHHASYAFDGGIYSSVFYMATGFHGAHVIIGTLFLIVCLLRMNKGHFTPDHHFGFEAAAWYWHFVDVVWLFLFICIYWWGNIPHV